MVETIFNAQTPGSESAVAGTARSLGMKWQTSGSGKQVTGGRVWIPTTGKPTGMRWQLWQFPSTLLQDIVLDSMSGTPASWMTVTGITPQAITAATNYIVVCYIPSTSAGNYPFNGSGGPITNGSITASNIFRNGGASNQAPNDETFTGGLFFADIELTDPTATGTLALTVPATTLALTGEATASGVVGVTVPATGLDFIGASAAGGNTVDPCGWTIPTPLCCPDWDTFSPTVQAAAQDYAALILWAATGRQYGLCDVTVRPCGMRACADGTAEFWGFDWSGGTWVPYIFNGVWFNCACPGVCCCEPRCQVRLMGPVASITEVLIGGIAVDPSAYRVDDNHWLVRTDGDCWPWCADMDSDDGASVFEVSYKRGSPVPAALLRAASTLACEFGKACVGGDCRLSPRVSSIVRNGITIDMGDPNDVLDNGLTGLWEVDTVIRALNPAALPQRLRIYAPELNVPRTVTSP
jgi:hypothetical protein